jgi:two-component system cell cycle response regulator DivK
MRVQEGRDTPIDILIAEDDALTRQVIRHLLEHEGYHCAEAGDGRETVALARQHLPKCVLLDLRMPQLDGFAVARRLRADPRTRSAALHCLTGWADEAARHEAQEAGCETFLTKPVDPDTLLQALRPQRGDPAEWAHGLTKAQAEDLLDWLEAQGAAGELALEAERPGFAVRCPGFRVERDASGRVRLSKG